MEIFYKVKPACVPTHLHSDDGVDEEQHGNEQADIGQGLKANTNRL